MIILHCKLFRILSACNIKHAHVKHGVAITEFRHVNPQILFAGGDYIPNMHVPVKACGGSGNGMQKIPHLLFLSIVEQSCLGNSILINICHIWEDSCVTLCCVKLFAHVCKPVCVICIVLRFICNCP